MLSSESQHHQNRPLRHGDLPLLLLSLAAYAAMVWLQRSRIGRDMRAVRDDEIAAEAGRYRYARRAGSHRARRRARNDPVDAERDDDAAREPRAMENSFPRRTPSEIESRERAEETATTTHLAA